MRTKTPIFSAWNYVGPAVEKEIRNEPPASIASSELVAVMVVAICPAALAESVKNEACRELATRFSMFYQRRPDVVLRLLATIRKVWTDTTPAARVRRHILTQAWTQDTVTNAQKEIVIAAELKLKLSAVKWAMQQARVKLPSFRPKITRELLDALVELRRLKYDVGLGTLPR